MLRAFIISAAGIMAGLLLCLAFGCQTAGIPLDDTQQQTWVPGSPLGKITTGMAYDTHIRVGKKQMSGIMYLRQTSRGVWRVAMTAKIGQTLFDFEIRPDTFVIHRSIDQLNKPLVLSYLERDLRLLTAVYPYPERIDAMPAGSGVSHYRVKVTGQKGWRHISRENMGQVVEIAYGGKRKKKTTVRFSEYENAIPYRITIDHRTIISFEIRMQLVPTVQD